MDAFVKSFSTYRTVKKAAVLSSALTLDSLDKENSTVTVKGSDIGRSDTGNWLIIDASVYLISQVKPQTDRTLLTLSAPLDAFSRALELSQLIADRSTVGSFVRDVMTSQWAQSGDAAYAISYLAVTSTDTAAYVEPELDSSGCFNLPDYFRLMRKSYRTTIRFFDAGSHLQCVISTAPVSARQISFADGHSQLQSVDYSAAGIAKLTVLCDVETGEKDENGDKILQRQRSTWYRSETGDISQTVPDRRASGEWSTVYVKGADKVEAKVIETFAKNAASHKLEFWSTLDLNVQDDCTFLVYGELLRSHISYKRKSSEDKRFYYKSGLLATTATEKLRGMKS